MMAKVLRTCCKAYIIKPTMVGKSHQRREEIVRAATQCFIKDGYERVSMDDIKERAGVSKGGLYHHFPTKEQLLIAVIESATVEVIAKLLHDLEKSPLEGVQLVQLMFDRQHLHKESLLELFGHLLSNEPTGSARVIIRQLWLSYIPVFCKLMKKLAVKPPAQEAEYANLLAMLMTELTLRVSEVDPQAIPDVVSAYTSVVAQMLGINQSELVLIPPARLRAITEFAAKHRAVRT